MNPEANKCPRCNAAMGDLDPTHYKIIDNLCKDCGRSEKTTDNCPHCGAEATGSTPFGTNYSCATVIIKDEEPEHKIRSFLCREREARQKAESERDVFKQQLRQVIEFAESYATCKAGCDSDCSGPNHCNCGYEEGINKVWTTRTTLKWEEAE
jgi:hypothetical protein